MKLFVATVLMIAWVSAVLLLPGCGGATSAEASVKRDLTFTLVNNSRMDIRSIGVEGTDPPFSYSPIQAGSRSMLKSKSLSLPETLTVHWTDERGDRHEGTVRCWSELGASYSGPVVMTITHRNKVVLTGG